MSPSSAGRRIENLLREEAPQVLGALVRRFGRFDVAEDATQEALISAHRTWRSEGIPDEPRSWLIRVAYRKLIDLLRSEDADRRREHEWLATDPRRRDPAAPEPAIMHADDSLELLVLCCHSALSLPSQIALTLRAIGGLTTAEIAHAYGVNEATMASRISRAKQTLKRADARFEITGHDDLTGRITAVMRVLYLIFNEGYAATTGPDLTRVDLSSEAIRLTRLLHAARPSDPEIQGLLALLLLTEARRGARQLDDVLVPLEQQDRSDWDYNLLAEGASLIQTAWEQGNVGPYQLQAAISALHTTAPDAASTDWPQIAALYLWLERLEPTNLIRLSRVVAVSRAFGSQRALALLAELDRTDALTADPLTALRAHVIKGHLCNEVGNHDLARDAFAAAEELATNDVEKRYLASLTQRVELPNPHGASGYSM